jgi:AhpD family alkylhydroperoxidase
MPGRVGAARHSSQLKNEEKGMPRSPRMNVAVAAPEVYRHLMQLEELVAGKLEPRLLHLLKLRASQINGCAYCIGMHTAEALRDGDTPERLTLLDAWPESSLYSEKERAALGWIEEITLIADSGASDEAYEKLGTKFSPEEIVWLTTAGTLINAWNRIAIASRVEYHAPHQPAAKTAEAAPAGEMTVG